MDLTRVFFSRHHISSYDSISAHMTYRLVHVGLYRRVTLGAKGAKMCTQAPSVTRLYRTWLGSSFTVANRIWWEKTNIRVFRKYKIYLPTYKTELKCEYSSVFDDVMSAVVVVDVGHMSQSSAPLCHRSIIMWQPCQALGWHWSWSSGVQRCCSVYRGPCGAV